MTFNDMKNLDFICLLILLSLCGVKAEAHNTDSSKVNFAYDVRFDMNFDNREFARNTFSNSETIFAARITPAIGFSVKQSGKIRHKVMLGADILKEFGDVRDSTLFNEMNLYYQFDKQGAKTGFSLQAGIFPRSSMEADYSEAFFSEYQKFYDNNLEGMLLKLRRPNAYFELGCDWMGKFGIRNRERFMVFSGGNGRIFPWFGYGYAAYMYHFSNSVMSKGVVDNFLVNPYLKLDMSGWTGLQAFSLNVGWIEAIQNDRKNVGKYIFSGGATVELDVRHWNAGICNKFYYGTTLMPLYYFKDSSGLMYADRLYFGDPFYRLSEREKYGYGFYNRVEAYYDLNLNDFLKMRLTAAFHFTHEKYAGCQQLVRIVFDLQELLDRK
jgi:hypothetical protein